MEKEASSEIASAREMVTPTPKSHVKVRKVNGLPEKNRWTLDTFGLMSNIGVSWLQILGIIAITFDDE